MLCIRISSEHRSFIVVESDDTTGHISVNSILDKAINVDSWHGPFIEVDSTLCKGILVSSDCSGFFEVESYCESFADVWSELYEGIFVSSMQDKFVSIWSDNDGFMNVESESTGGIQVESHCDLSGFDISSFGISGIDVYSSYVCHIDNSGYLIIENLAGDTDPPEPITLFILKNSYNEIKVLSNLDWIIN